MCFINPRWSKITFRFLFFFLLIKPKSLIINKSLSPPVQLEGVLCEPACTARASLGVGVANTTAQTTMSASSSSLSTQLTVLVRGIAYPVNRRISTDVVMVGIEEDGFIIFEGGVLGNPIAVQQAQAPQPTAHTFLQETISLPPCPLPALSRLTKILNLCTITNFSRKLNF